ncbi:MAG: penicillin-binding protein 2 [Rickettsiales bacterium]|jgi:cell division protein FtsI (penicillin-binding protein 3)|nr:penicillin-binding protein 2 [Rickettsiales bacterium]
MTYNIGSDISKKLGLGRRVGAAARGIRGRRLGWVGITFMLAMILFSGKTLYYGLEGTNRTRLKSGGATWVASRADIVDRNGTVLAKSVMSGHINLISARVGDRDAVAGFIHEIMPEYDVSEILAQIDSKKFKELRHFANDDLLRRVANAGLAGLEVAPIERRKYPKHREFSHILGFVGKDGVGLDGAEKIKDRYLTENTDPLVLSLDSRIQGIMYQELSVARQKYSAIAAMGILMKSGTGEIIAMVSLPDYEPEDLSIDPPENRVMRTMRNLYEMGSVFKVFNTAMALENGLGLDKKYFIAKPYKVLDKFGRTAATISDVASFKPPSPYLNVAQIMLHSCNVGSAQIALDLPNDAQMEFFNRIHMGGPLDLEFGRSERTLMHKRWGPTEIATASFGHGVSVTPMHVVLGVNAMTNGGYFVMPTIFKKTNDAEISGQRVVSAEISDTLRKIMYRITTDTTGKLARVNGINIGGKTATAEKRLNGKTDRSRNITSFTGIFPIENPRYIMMILLDEPKGIQENWYLRTAAWNAAPTAQKIMESAMPLLFE